MTLPYNGYHIECLRFGSRKGGKGMGCCAVDIIQNFNHAPDAEVPDGFVPIYHGDSGVPLIDYSTGAPLGFGPTNLDVFLGFLGTGTFNAGKKADKTFIAVMTAAQVSSPTGRKWLKILKEHGFEFIRAVNNSVYGGDGGLAVDADMKPAGAPHLNYIFGLFRNITNNQVPDPFAPPEEWAKLPEVSKQQVIDLWRAGYPEPFSKPEAAPKPTAESKPATKAKKKGGVPDNLAEQAAPPVSFRG